MTAASFILTVLLGGAVIYIVLLRGKARADKSREEFARFQLETLAALQERQRDLQAKLAQKDAALTEEKARRAAFNGKIAAAQGECGLKTPLSPADFGEWLRQCAAAHKADAERRSAAEQRSPLLRQERDLRKEFAALNEALPFLPAPQADFSALLAAARQKQQETEQQLRAVQTAAQEIENYRAVITEKQQKQAKARARMAEIERQRAEIARQAFAGAVPSQALRGSLSALRRLYDAKEKGASLLRQIQAAAAERSRLRAALPAAAEAGFHVSSALDLAEQDKRQADDAYTKAVARRAEIEERRRAISGDADIAALAQEKEACALELAECAEDYLQNRIGLDLAREALRRYSAEHRTDMMQLAEQAFAALTKGAYPKLEAQAEGDKEVLLALVKGGGSKRAEDMSKGTRFQLYMALRAAAYEQLLAQGKNLPFFCDDIFETFDEERTESACRLMQHISRRGQAIYLTHHRHVAEIAQRICGDEVRIHEMKQGE